MKIFTSCDSKYFMDHGLTLIKSCFDHGHSIRVNIVNPTDRVDGKVKKLHDDHRDKFNYSYDYSQKNPDRSYFASSRFLILSNLLTACEFKEDYLVVDTDSFFMRPFPEIPKDKEFGIMLREPDNPANEWERRGMLCAAGLVYVRHDATLLARRVAEKIRSYGLRWFVDQVALHEAYKEIYEQPGQEDKVFYFDLEHLDWEFSDDSIIWSGKGNRKSTNKKYLEMKDKIGRI